MKSCKICNNQIPEGRIKALPNVETCINCSTTDKKAGFRLITGKNTYTELQIVDQKTFQKLTNLQERKGSSPSNGIKMK